MKIEVQEKPRLSNGRHTVTITDIAEGKSEYKNILFFTARMENEDGFVENRFYDSEPSKPILAELMEATGLQGDALDTKELRGKELSIEVYERSYPDPETGAEKTITEARNFKMTGKANTSEEPRS